MTTTIEICVVFTKDTLPEEACALFDALEYPYREGSDSSRGRLYFDNTGPRFIVSVERAALARFMAAISSHASVHEAYAADFNTFKD